MAATPVYEDYLPFATPPMENGLNLDFDWPPLEFDGSLSTPTDPPPSAPEPTPDIENDCSLTDPAAICARQLSDLSVEIDRVYSNIPTHVIMHISKNDPISDVAKTWAEKYSQRQCLEKLFTAGQQLLDIYPRAVGLILKPEQDEDCQDTACLHRQDLPSELQDYFTAAGGKKIPVDMVLLNLLITCHMRVSDILGHMLFHVQMCAKITLALPEKEPDMQIPELRVGNFVASAEASSTMQLMLLIHIMSGLAERAKKLNDRVNEATKEDSSTKQARMIKLQCEVLVDGAESRVLELQKVRDIVNKLGFNKGLQSM
jgi:hypothetical protein